VRISAGFDVGARLLAERVAFRRHRRYPPTMRRPTPRALLMWGGIVVSFLFIYLAFRGTDFGALRAALGRSNYWTLIPAFLVLAVAIVLRAVRWRLLISPEHRPSMTAVTSALLIGYLFNSILPARAGEGIRVVVLRQRAGTPKSEGLGTVVAERAIDVLTLLVLLFTVAPVVPSADWLPRVVALAVVLFVVTAGVFTAFAFYGERPARLLLRPLGVLPRMSRERIELAAANLMRGLSAFRRPAVALPAFSLTAASWLLIAFASWICMRGFDLRLGFSAAILVVVAINLAMILPSGPAGIGVFEAATLTALHPFDVDRTQALSYALVLHGMNVVPFIVVGYLALQHHALAPRHPVPGGETGTASSGRTVSPS
jgi:glycosyltransferase 2 family protein